jgi:hypothetical protein
MEFLVHEHYIHGKSQKRGRGRYNRRDGLRL